MKINVTDRQISSLYTQKVILADFDMDIQPIDQNAWERSPYFEHYFHQVCCTYRMTVDLDVTELIPALKSRGCPFYPAMIYLMTKVVNRHRNFPMTTQGDQLGAYDQLISSYTTFHPDDKTVSTLWTEYDESFKRF